MQHGIDNQQHQVGNQPFIAAQFLPVLLLTEKHAEDGENGQDSDDRRQGEGQKVGQLAVVEPVQIQKRLDQDEVEDNFFRFFFH